MNSTRREPGEETSLNSLAATPSRAGALLLLLLLPFGLASADPAPDAHRQAMHDAVAAARAALVRGPKEVALRDQASLGLPEGFGFIPQQPAARLMQAMGNRTDQDFIGLIVPLGEQGHGTEWFVSVEYNASGYVKDDDARNWDADKLLRSLKEGTEAANEQREQAGVPPIEVTRWVEPPAYDGATHRLVWAAEARSKNRPDPDPGVNYNTYLLGREGYLSLNLITSSSTVDTDKVAAHTLLNAVKFNAGKAYGDFNSSTDKVAAYGLAALVVGVAAKKLGLIAIIIATVVKFAKAIIIAVAAAVAAIRRWMKSRATRTA
jgi:uncharacterized membrane-anchored protein